MKTTALALLCLTVVACERSAVAEPRPEVIVITEATPGYPGPIAAAPRVEITIDERTPGYPGVLRLAHAGRRNVQRLQ